MEKNKYNKTLIACYLGFITQAICANFVPLLYINFNKTYNISLSKLALVSTIFFFTQLVVDYLCTKVVDKLGYRVCVVASEVTAFLGLAGLAFIPELFNTPYIGIIVCVILYAIGSGLIEVLVSPIVDACPFDNKDGVMSILHSFYCWGSVGVILGSTIFFALFGINNWKIMAVIWSLIPLFNVFNFIKCPIVQSENEEHGLPLKELFKTKLFWLFIILMICAGASEISMAQWASAFVESSLHLSKTIGDIVGPCGFAISMGISRVIYGKISEKVDLIKWMIISGSLCVVSYILVGLFKLPIISLIGCILCGFSVGIMWPGSIRISSKLMPKAGTSMFAMLALAGDLGGSIGPSLVGNASQLLNNNLQLGIFFGIIFPIVLILIVILVKHSKNNNNI